MRRAWMLGMLAATVAASAGGARAQLSHPQGPDKRVNKINRAAVDASRIDALLRDGARVIVLGDSFSIQRWSRVFPALTRRWDYGVPTAICGSASNNTDVVKGIQVAESTGVAEAGTDRPYLMMRGQPPINERYYALPLRGVREFWFNRDLAADPGEDPLLMEFRLANGAYEQRTGEPFADRDEPVKLRFLFWAPDNGDLFNPSYLVQENNQTLSTFNPTTASRPKLVLGENPTGSSTPPNPLQINAAPKDVQAEFDVLRPNLEVAIRVDESATGNGMYAHPAGMVFYRVDGEGDRLPGVYYSSLADNSWSYSGFGADYAARNANEKVYSADQLAAWIDATTLDVNQPVVVFYYLAAENLLYQASLEKFEAMIDVTEAAAAAAGLPGVTHCFTLPHFHTINGDAGSLNRLRFEAQRNAMFQLADERENVAALSIYDATGGVLFDGSQDALDWVRANGHCAFELATLEIDLSEPPFVADFLDGSGLHPKDAISADFFAEVLDRLIRTPGLSRDLTRDRMVDLEDLIEQYLAPEDIDQNGKVEQADTDALETFIRRDELNAVRSQLEPSCD